MPVMNLFPGGSTVQIPLDAPTSFSATAGNAQVELTWTDPLDKYATPEGEVSETGDQLVSEWDHTVLVRKTGSQPAGPNDGTVVTSSSVRNQYQTNGYTDTGLINDTVYYYAVFAYNKDGVASEGAFVSATPQAGTPLGDLTEGTLISINESGAPVEFYVAKQGYEPTLNGPNRVLMVRKDPYTGKTIWDKSSSLNYSISIIDKYLNSTYKSVLSSYVQLALGETTIRCMESENNPTEVTINRAVFALSLKELGKYLSSVIQLGTPLPIASILTTPPVSSQWTRSPQNDGGLDVAIIDGSAGNAGNARTVRTMYSIATYIPCFTLPSTALVDSNNALIET